MSDTEISAWREWGQQLDVIDLSADAKGPSPTRDVVGKLITGRHEHFKFHGNFLRCAFRTAILTDVDFHRSDCKDTSFIDVEFVDSVLGGGSTVSCTYSGCTFIRCEFTDSAIHDSLYRNCTFIGCDFQDSMLRNTEITGCEFERCVTSNKLFEGCRLFENRFDNTWLDFAAITDNFGLDSVQLPQDWLRENRTAPEGKSFSMETRLSDAEWQLRLTTFDKVKLQFYLSGGHLEGSDTVDTAFKPESWVLLVRAPINLMRLLQDFGEFIFHLYRSDRLASIFVLKLADLARSIWDGYGGQPDQAMLAQVGAAVYFQCLQLLTTLDAAIASEVQSYNTRVIYRSKDDADDAAIADLAAGLSKLVPEAGVRVSPRNSPVDLILTGLSNSNIVFLVALFFTTKTRLQIAKVPLQEPGKTERQANPPASFTLALGAASEATSTEVLALEQYVPGLLYIRFDVRFSTALSAKVKSIIQAIGH